MFKNKELIFSILVPVILGSLVGLLVMPSMDSYEKLIKPDFVPPNYVFPIVWTILYILMGISFYLISSTNSYLKARGETLYFAQLLVNLIWPIIFFVLKLRFFAFVWIIILIILIIMMINNFYKICKKAALIQIPYLLWTTFAAFLNFSIYWLNK